MSETDVVVTEKVLTFRKVDDTFVDYVGSCAVCGEAVLTGEWHYAEELRRIRGVYTGHTDISLWHEGCQP